MDDGSLTHVDRNCLLRHIEGLKFYRINEVDVGKCPKGGCGERLCLIIRLSQDYYVIQLDSDTLTRSSIKEVLSSVHNNISFALPTLENKSFVSLEEIHNIVKDWQIDFVQVHAEREMKNIDMGRRELQYIRANAAFAGFGRGMFDFSFLEKFSCEMESILGKSVWGSWGSEQVASNFLIANSPQKIALPYPKYAGYYPVSWLLRKWFIL